MADEPGAGQGFGDLAFAMQMRDAIREIIRSELDSLRPTPTYAKVSSIDLAGKFCMVVITGDTVAIKASYGAVAPSAVNQIVRLEGPPGDRYISDVLGETEDNKTIGWSAPPLLTNVAANAIDPPRYRLITVNGQKRIELKGRVDLTGTSVVTLWYMPVGFRPPVNLAPVVCGRNIDGGSNVALLDILADGSVNLIGGTTGVKPGNTMDNLVATTSSVDPEDVTTATDVNHKHITTDGPAPTNTTWTSFVIGNQGYNYNHTHGVTGSHSHTVPVHSHGLNNVTFPNFLSLNGVYWYI